MQAEALNHRPGPAPEGPKPQPPAARANPATITPADGNANMQTVMRIPVVVQVVLGSATLPVANVLKLARGSVVPLDHRVGEPVDVVVNGRLVARGEVVVLEEDHSRLGVSITELAGNAASQRGD